VSLLLPNYYSAEARVLPPQPSQSAASALLGQLGPLAGLAGRDMGLKNGNDIYIAMLKSRTVADSLIREFGLQEVYGAANLTEARDRLARLTEVVSTKDNVVSIAVEDRDPARAASIANGYVRHLETLNNQLAISEAAQRRLFFERQLKHAKSELMGAEQELKKTQQGTGGIQLDSQARAMIQAVANLRAQIAAREITLGGMQTFATEANPQMVQLRQELASMRTQLGKLEQTGGGSSGMDVPTAGLEYIRKFREVKYNEAVFELLAKQYEAARIDEAKDAALIQILDPAIPPERKSRPQRAWIVLLTMLVAALFSIVWAFILEFIAYSQQDPLQQMKVGLLKQYWTR